MPSRTLCEDFGCDLLCYVHESKYKQHMWAVQVKTKFSCLIWNQRKIMFLVGRLLRDYLYHVSMFLPCCWLQVSCWRKLRVLFKPSGMAYPVLPTAQDLPLKQQQARARLKTLGKKQVMCVVNYKPSSIFKQKCFCALSWLCGLNSQQPRWHNTKGTGKYMCCMQYCCNSIWIDYN